MGYYGVSWIFMGVNGERPVFLGFSPCSNGKNSRFIYFLLTMIFRPFPPLELLLIYTCFYFVLITFPFVPSLFF